MDMNTALQNKERLLDSIPELSSYINDFKAINKRWGGTITAGMIEAGRMPTEAAALFGPLIEDMRETKTQYGTIQQQLMDAILFEMFKKVIFEIQDSAKFAINILKRNLFERTADVGYLATDGEIVEFLKFARQETDKEIVRNRAELVRQRLADYQYEYTVYNEIIIVDTRGKVLVNFDTSNKVSQSRDSLLNITQNIDLHRGDEEPYVETFAASDLLPNRGEVLIYSQKIEDPDTNTSLGTLCLCFNFADEMDRIFSDLAQGNENIIVAILNDQGRVMFVNDPAMVPSTTRFSIDLSADHQYLTVDGRIYLASIRPTDGYQGFMGLTWYGLAMIEVKTAFSQQKGEGIDVEDAKKTLTNLSQDLAVIKKRSEDLLDDMKVDGINGQVKALQYNAKAFVEVLHYVNWIGEEVNSLFSSAIGNLQDTIIQALFSDIQFRAFQGNNIADRNLYERANDVCWWALTPLFRETLAILKSGDITDDERGKLTRMLQYINDLYTPYLRLVLADTNGMVVAVSEPPDELEEILLNDDLPRGQMFVGTALDPTLVKKALGLKSSKDYCVSEFQPSPLYGDRPTYIYSTAVRDPKNENKTVGVIQIVFDSEPQFRAMLHDVLPKDEQKNIKEGCFALFAGRDGTIISSTNPEYPEGSQLNLDQKFFAEKKGVRRASIIEFDGHNYALGLQVSEGYREYKIDDGYKNDVICFVFILL